MKRPEDALQIACADLCRLILHPSIIWHHSVNEGKRSKAAAGLAKAMGQRAGWPDFVFLWSEGGDGGCCEAAHVICAFVELKAPKGVLSPAQKTFKEAADAIGAEWALCRSVDDFHATLKAWGVPTKAKTEAA